MLNFTLNFNATCALQFVSKIFRFKSTLNWKNMKVCSTEGYVLGDEASFWFCDFILFKAIWIEPNQKHSTCFFCCYCTIPAKNMKDCAWAETILKSSLSFSYFYVFLLGKYVLPVCLPEVSQYTFMIISLFVPLAVQTDVLCLI